MKRIWIFIAMMFIFSSCSVFKDITKRGQIVDFTKKYRSYFSNTELKSADAAFLTRDRIELVGLPKNGKVIAFDNYDVVPGNWEHLIIKAGTYGKIRFINKKDSNVFDVIFDETKDTIKFCFRPVDKGEIWTFDKKTDASPNVPPVIQEKYQFSDGWEYIYTQMNTIFEEYGVKSIGETGESFDHNIHHSIEMVFTDKKEDDHKIAEVIQKGYKLGDRVIRPARVNVFEYHESGN